MPRTISITANALRFVLPHLCTEPGRPVLGALYVEPSGTITATNSKTLVTHRNAATLDGPAVLLAFQKPKALTARSVDRVTLDIPDGPTPTMTATLLDKNGRPIGSTLATLVEGPYPETRQLFRRAAAVIRGEHPPISALCLDPALVALFDVHNGGPVSLHFDGDRGGAVVLWGTNPDAIGLLMPCQPLPENLRNDGAAFADTITAPDIPARWR